jgi:hypothetical protein
MYLALTPEPKAWVSFSYNLASVERYLFSDGTFSVEINKHKNSVIYLKIK